MAKSLEEQVADKYLEIASLQTQIAALRIEALPKYPKHIRVPVPDQPDVSRTMLAIVNSEEEEYAALGKTAPKASK